tara:strand:- start:540 stop:1988 length:1449 start_codon:yes stop_codon:yes gene_type:complete
MIYSMISKTIKSMITTVINPFDGLLSRYFVTLDPVLNSYYQTAAPIVFTGDFEIEFEVSGQDLTSDQALIDSSVFNGLIAGEILLYIDNPNGLDLLICDGANDFTRQTFGGQSVILNSKLNTISVNRLNGVITSKLNNVQLGGSITNSETIRFSEKLIGGGSSRKFNGIIANAKFTDKSGASDVTTTFKLDQATANTEYSQENVFGAEEVVNGDFATDLNGWDNSNSWWQWVSGRAYHAYSASYNPLQQLGVIPPNSTVRITLQHEVLQGQGRLTIAGTGGSLEFQLSGTGTLDFIHTNTTNSDEYIILARQVTVGFAEFYVDNVSVKEITNAVEYKNIPQSARELYSLEDDTWTGSNELVINGDFATDSDWNLEAGVAISDGKLAINSNINYANLADQNLSFAVGKTFEIEVKVSGYISGDINIRQGTSGADNILAINANGTYKVIFTGVGSSSFTVRSSASPTVGDVDSISVREIIEVAS